MEALVPPGGGPPPHIHTREDETYYLLAGQIEVLLGEETIVIGPHDFVNIPRGIVHCFRNTGTETARMLLTFTPAGIEKWFEETLERAPNDAQEAPDNIDEVVARLRRRSAEVRPGVRLTVHTVRPRSRGLTVKRTGNGPPRGR